MWDSLKNFNGTIFIQNFRPKIIQGGFMTNKKGQPLSDRESQVIECIKVGMSNDEIAEKLGIASATAKHHLTNIFKKLGVTNRLKLLFKLRDEQENDLPPAA